MNTKKYKLIYALLLASLLGFSSGTAIALESEEPETISVNLTVDGKSRSVFTSEDTVGEVLKENSLSVTTKDLVTPSVEAPVEHNESIVLVKGKRLKFAVGANKTYASNIPVLTVSEALSRERIRLRAHDRVSPRLSAKVETGDKITVTRIKYRAFSKTVKIHRGTKYVKTKALYRGVRKVKSRGQDGSRKITYKKKFVNGEKVSVKRIKNQIKKHPRKRVILVGVKKRPATLSGVWRALAQCESGGKPSIVSSNGLYHGLFQFSVSTWHSVGGSGLPSRASVAEQLKRAKILQARSGWGQWPHCSSKLGLR